MIEIQNATKFYNKQKVLDNFSLKIENAQRVVLFGRSGSGKTTLLRVIAGLETLDSGKIYINNILVTDGKKILVEPHLRDIGMVFQDLALWPHLNVAQNIEFALKIKKISKESRKEIVVEILEKMNLSGFAHKKVYELSGGEQQRVALARVLVLRPSIILMDEPLSSLDYDLNLKMRAEILNLQREFSFTLVYVTHNRDEALFLSNRIIEFSSFPFCFYM